MTKTFVFNALPQSLDELKALPEADLQDPFKTAALTVLVLSVYPKNKDAALEMLEFLSGPAGVSAYDKSFIKERFSDKDYVPRSFFKGAAVDNNYEPSKPYTVSVSDNPYSYSNENYATLYLTSGGADNPRPVTMRQKPSTGEWFINQYGGLLMGIKIPKALDPWA